MLDNNQESDNSSVTNSEPAPKVKKKTADKRTYMREYYHTRQKEDVQCEFCDKVLSCKSSLVYHMRHSQKCAITQALVALDELNKHADNLRKFARYS
jgi:hypothetical protein